MNKFWMMLVVLFAALPVACASASGEDPGSDDSYVDEGNECRDVPEQGSDVTHRMCCDGGQEAAWSESCNHGVAIGCVGQDDACILSTDDGQNFTCPKGMSCQDCAYNTMGQLTQWCNDQYK